MALILNIETSTDVCSVALSKDGNLIAGKENFDGYNHATKLTVLVEELFKEVIFQITEIDAVAVSCGPGSYTGLRIGVSTAKGICYGANCKLLAISSLQILAHAAIEKLGNNIDLDAILCPMIDARRMEVYTALYDQHLVLKSDIEAKIIDESSFEDVLNSNTLIFCGNGSEKCEDTIISSSAKFIKGIKPLAKDMIKLSERAFSGERYEDVAYFEPFYLKDFIATKPKKKVF